MNSLWSNIVGKYPLYAISGISGSGKTTLGRILASKITHNGVSCVFVDQDQFYIGNKPLVTLSNGITLKNWDTLDALNPKMVTIIQSMLDHAPVVLVGFALSEQILFSLKPQVHIHLVTANNPSDLSRRCKMARAETKPGLDTELDDMMVDEVVIPYYREIIRHSAITHLVHVFDETTGKRRSPAELVVQLLTLIEDETERSRAHVMNVSEPYHTLIGIEEKTVEGRKISPTWSKIRAGDTIIMACDVKPEDIGTAPAGYGTGHVFSTVVVEVKLYLPCFGDPLGRYLKEETLERTLPGVTDINKGRDVYLQWFSETDINNMGMMAIHVRVQ